MRIITVFFSIIIVLLGLTFALLNSEPVLLHYYLGTIKVPLSMLLVSILVVGSLLGLLVGLVNILKLKLLNRKLRKQIELFEKEISKLRLLTIKEHN